MPEAFASLNGENPLHVEHPTVHGVLHQLDSVMETLAGLLLSHAPHVVVQRVEVWRARRQ